MFGYGYIELNKCQLIGKLCLKHMFVGTNYINCIKISEFENPTLHDDSYQFERRANPPYLRFHFIGTKELTRKALMGYFKSNESFCRINKLIRKKIFYQYV